MPCHVTGRIRIVLARPSPRSTWWFGDLRGDVLNGEIFLKPWIPITGTGKVGEISDWKNHHEIFLCFFCKTKKKRFVVSLHLFFF